MSHGYQSPNYPNGQRHPQYQQDPVQNRPASETHRASNRPNYAHRTTTTVQSHIQNKLPTLVLKLQQRASMNRNDGKSHGHRKSHKLADLSDRELDEYLAANLRDFKRELMNNIDNFHQIILSAKPNPAKQRDDPEGYNIHLQQYQEFLQLANEIMKRMQDSFNDILTRFREYIDELWDAICQGQDVRQVQFRFEQHMQQNMARYWKPIFDRADQLIAEIDANFNQHSVHPQSAYKSSH